MAEGQVWVSQGADSGKWKRVSSGSDKVIAVTSDKEGVKVSHKVSGAKVATIGKEDEIPVLTIDEYGHVTTLSFVNVYPPTSKGESGQIWTSGGSEKEGSWVNPSDMKVGAAVNADRAITADVALYAQKIINASDQEWNVGSATQGIYFEEGVPKACKYDFATITFKEIDDMDTWKEQE